MSEIEDKLRMKIVNRDTELQRVYDKTVSDLKALRDKKDRIDLKIKERQKTFDLCIKRAEEQNCLDILINEASNE